jgi:hypothetical protein
MLITFFGARVYEIDVLLTDYLLVAEGLFLGLYSLRKFPRHLAKDNSVAHLCGYLFLALAASSFLGGTYHGFFPRKTATSGGLALWICTLLTLGLAASLLWRISLTLWLGKKHLYWRTRINLAAFLTYASCILFIKRTFQIAILYYLPPLIVLFFCLLREFTKYQNRKAFYGICGISLTFVAAYVQQAHLSVPPFYLNYNSLYHLIQAIGLFLIFLSLTQIDSHESRETRQTLSRKDVQ